ncbi:MAG: 4-vinyl reductase, partial [Nitrososphaerota archaeon]
GRFLRSLGYARELNISRIDGGIEAVLIDSLECQIQAKLRRIPSSNWTRGLIAGIATDLMERDCSAEEVECINLGYPHCRIVAKKTS